MTELETQIGQIHISDRKLSKSFISLYSESFQETETEGYFLMEIPVLNPAIWTENEALAVGLQSSFRKNLKKTNPNAFENAVAQINEDLSAAASEGQTSWVGKLAACLAAKKDNNIYIATTGKIHAYLFRNGQLSNIADTETSNSPLKTFANFAQGKIRQEDIVILSTPQLFNYISVERLKSLLSRKSVAEASEEIAQIIKNNADDDISFATFILKISPAGSAASNIIDLSKTLSNNTSFLDKAKVPFVQAKKLFAHTLLLSKRARLPEMNLPKVSAPSLNIKELVPSLRSFFNINKYKQLNRPKKFFLIAALIFILVLIVNVGVVIHSHSKTKYIDSLNAKLSDVENKINNANAAFIIHDESKAMSSVSEAAEELSSIPDDKNIIARKQQITAELANIQNNVGHIQKIDPTEILTYSSAAIDDLQLIKDQLFLVNLKGSLVVPYTISKKTLGKDTTLSMPAISKSANADGNLFFEDSQGNIYAAGTDLKSATKESGLLPSNTAGFEIYGAPEKAYAVNPDSNQIVYTNVSANVGVLSYIKDNTSVSDAIDMAIDGSVYVVNPNGILKFTKGLKQGFFDLGTKFTNNSRIRLGTKNVYILDPGNKKIVIAAKSGQLLNQFVSDKFDNLRDIAVDEPNHVMYILNGSKIYTLRLQ